MRSSARREQDSLETEDGSITARSKTGTKNEECLDREVIAADTVGDVEVDQSTGEPPRMLEMEVNGKKIQFELDTGASLSIIDEKTWNKLGRPQLNKAAVAATAFDNNPIKSKEESH
ncbi:hypothetical protein OSTOST_05509 [Ostertagia ostertagi]